MDRGYVVRNSFSRFDNLANFIAGFQSMFASEHRKTLLGAKFDATLATTGCQDGTAGASAHASTEAVVLSTTTVVRLESALAHCKVSLDL